MPELKVERVTKRYGDFEAVKNVSFTARPGRILGLLGPNGAGKTSIIRMVTHITAPDRGHIHFGDRRVGSWTQQQMGYLPEERGLYKKLSVKEQLYYLAQLKGISRSTIRKRMQYWLDRFEASDWIDKETGSLSKGMQQKVQFVATVLHDPRLLIFDEPFSGLDPINANLLRDVVLELRDDQRTVLFASHRMEQVEQICDDICLLSEGGILLQGSVREVKQRFGRETVLLGYDGPDAFLDALERDGMIHVHQRTVHRAEMRLLNGTPARTILAHALEHVDVHHFERVEPPLNEIFVSAVNGSARAAAAPLTDVQRTP